MGEGLREGRSELPIAVRELVVVQCADTNTNGKPGFRGGGRWEMGDGFRCHG